MQREAEEEERRKEEEEARQNKFQPTYDPIEFASGWGSEFKQGLYDFWIAGGANFLGGLWEELTFSFTVEEVQELAEFLSEHPDEALKIIKGLPASIFNEYREN